MDQKAKLKAMIGHIIEKNDEAAKKELHSYLATKMQQSMSNAKITEGEVQQLNGFKVGDKVAFTGAQLKPPKTWEGGTITKIFDEPKGAETCNIDWYVNGSYKGPSQSDYNLIAKDEKFPLHWCVKQ